MKIGLFGFDFRSSNMGCEALTYTFLNMIERLCLDNEINVVNFSYKDNLGNVPEYFKRMKFSNYRIHLKSPKNLMQLFKEVKNCDMFFDATFGDGFSDIYGKRWNVITDIIKQIVLCSKTPLILLPQTYGPFSSKLLEKWAMQLIKKASFVYSRDELSAKYIKGVCDYDIKVATDMAFKLPFDSTNFEILKNKVHVGINISSLLWDSEWAKENYFGLKVDYRQFHEKLIEKLLEDEKYAIHVIPHVIDLEEPESRENDYRVCLEMKKKYSDKVFIAPPFESPIEAKSYISNMDVFIGARMHATIAAISAGVATIPFSYSRKFEGLYGNLQYPYVISAKKIDTEQALHNVIKWIGEPDVLRNAGKCSVSYALTKLEILEVDLKEFILNHK